MSNFESPVSVCRHCQNYYLEGRRGGYCTQLSSPVQGCWKACALAIPPFAPSWESHTGFKEEIAQILWKQQQVLAAERAMANVIHPEVEPRVRTSLEACVPSVPSTEETEDYFPSESAAVQVTTEAK